MESNIFDQTSTNAPTLSKELATKTFTNKKKIYTFSA